MPGFRIERVYDDGNRAFNVYFNDRFIQTFHMRRDAVQYVLEQERQERKEKQEKA